LHLRRQGGLQEERLHRDVIARQCCGSTGG
jgi:hypothetical protein